LGWFILASLDDSLDRWYCSSKCRRNSTWWVPIHTLRGQTAGMERERKYSVWRPSTARRDGGLSGKTPDYECIEQRVLVIGVGSAGARTAIELVERGVDPQKILVMGKRTHGDAHTMWARGGIYGALGIHDLADDSIIAATFVTSLPTVSTVPEKSQPGFYGRVTSAPFTPHVIQSYRFTPAAATRTRTSSGAGSGLLSVSSCSCSRPSNSCNLIACINCLYVGLKVGRGVVYSSR